MEQFNSTPSWQHHFSSSSSSSRDTFSSLFEFKFGFGTRYYYSQYQWQDHPDPSFYLELRGGGRGGGFLGLYHVLQLLIQYLRKNSKVPGYIAASGKTTPGPMI